MRHNHIFRASDILPPDEDLPEDDLDKLFMNNLPRLEPPPELIAQILSTVGQLPSPSSEPPLAQDQPGCGVLDGPVVPNEKRDPA